MIFMVISSLICCSLFFATVDAGTLQAINIRPNKIVGGVTAERGRYGYYTTLLYPFCQDSGSTSCTTADDELYYADTSETGVAPTGESCFTGCTGAQATDCCSCCGGGNGSFHIFECGGSLIAPNVILSAAHCFFEDASANIVLPDEVGVATYDLTEFAETAERFRVLEHVVHPNYDPETNSFDFMLLRLDGESSITPVALDNGACDINDGSLLTVIGLGDTQKKNAFKDEYEFPQVFPNVLQEVELQYISNAQCNIPYSNTIDSTMICTFTPGKDSCQGDSGGPIFIKGANSSLDIQVGLVSFGAGCAVNFPGVYSRIGAVYPWIESTVDSWGASLRESTVEPGDCNSASKPVAILQYSLMAIVVVWLLR